MHSIDSSPPSRNLKFLLPEPLPNPPDAIQSTLFPATLPLPSDPDDLPSSLLATVSDQMHLLDNIIHEINCIPDVSSSASGEMSLYDCEPSAETPTSEHLLHLEIVKAVETFTVSPVTSSALVPTPFVHGEKPPPSVHGETLPTSNSATAAVAATAATTFSRTTFGKLATHPKVVFDRGKLCGDLFVHATRHFPYDRGKLFVFSYVPR